NLSGANLSGPIPEELGELADLRVLNLTGNSLNASIPSSLSGLTNLTHLLLADNNLEGVFPFVGNMRQLSSINVSSNRISGSIPELRGTSVDSIDISNNRFTGTLQWTLHTWFMYMDASNNNLSGAVELDWDEWGPDCDLSGNPGLCVGSDHLIRFPSCYDVLKRCTGSEDCHVLHNWEGSKYRMHSPYYEHPFRNEDTREFCCEEYHDWYTCENYRIVEINLSGANLSGPIPEELGELADLRMLNLTGNALNASIPSSFAGLTNLTHLLLADNNLEGGLPFLGNMSQLEFLNVSSNSISGSIVQLESLTTIRSLDVSNNQLSGTLPASITSLKNLILFDISRNNLSGELSPEFTEWKVDVCDVSENSDLCIYAGQSTSCFDSLRSMSCVPNRDEECIVSWATVIDVDALPNECFGGIQDRCIDNSTIEEFTCSNADVSNLLVESILGASGLSGEIYLPLKTDEGFSSVASYTSTCQNGTEDDWTGTVQLTTEFGIVVVQQTPSFTSFSFLSIESFSTSSVQFACVIENGEEVLFSAIVGGIVAGQRVTESQYNCRKFFVETVTLNANSTMAPATTSGESNLLPEISSEGLLIAEYAIVAAYILISYAAAFVALRRRRLQRSMSDFKMFLNTSFAALFLVWGTGNLMYAVLFSALLDDGNFFLIKSVLTLTYFFTYYGFALAIHYRFHGLVSRTSPYNMAIDGALFVVNSLVCFSYLSITLTVEYCNGRPTYQTNRICDFVTASRSLFDLYQS
ncbi:MAG: hypothetical protein SGCHY_005188, partial [Lobulomycetales sp.]